MLIPGISFVLENTGFVDKTWFKAEHADRGKAVHAACLYLMEGKLDWATVHDSIRPRVEGFQAFLEKFRPEIVLAETPLYSQTRLFAGIPDLALKMLGGIYCNDIKSGKSGLAAKLQTAAQKILLEENGYGPIDHRYALELPAEGGYKMVHHFDRGDEPMFLNALAMIKRRINEKELAL
jgi:hypothetical protein